MVFELYKFLGVAAASGFEVKGWSAGGETINSKRFCFSGNTSSPAKLYKFFKGEIMTLYRTTHSANASFSQEDAIHYLWNIQPGASGGFDSYALADKLRDFSILLIQKSVITFDELNASMGGYFLPRSEDEEELIGSAIKFLGVIFDDYTEEEEITRSQVCGECLKRYPALKAHIAGAGEDVCGVEGCECTMDVRPVSYITLRQKVSL